MIDWFLGFFQLGLILLGFCFVIWAGAWLVHSLPGRRGRTRRAMNAARARHVAARKWSRGDTH